MDFEQKTYMCKRIDGILENHISTIVNEIDTVLLDIREPSLLEAYDQGLIKVRKSEDIVMQFRNSGNSFLLNSPYDIRDIRPSFIFSGIEEVLKAIAARKERLVREKEQRILKAKLYAQNLQDRTMFSGDQMTTSILEAFEGQKF